MYSKSGLNIKTTFFKFSDAKLTAMMLRCDPGVHVVETEITMRRRKNIGLVNMILPF